MANTLGILSDPSPLLGVADPFDFLGTIAPFTAFDDTTAPLVTLVSPLIGALSRLTPIVFRVVDNLGLGVHVINVEYVDISGLYECAWDGELINGALSSNTRGAYSVSRTVVAATASTAAGWEYTVLRRKGWLAKPILRVRAADLRGNVV